MKPSNKDQGSRTGDRDKTVPSLDAQAAYWRDWNLIAREGEIAARQERQAGFVAKWMNEFQQPGLCILEVGCGSGWLCERLVRHGDVTGLDLSDDMLKRAAVRVPEARFVAGNIMSVDLPSSTFDVIVSLEVLAHVEDQAAFFSRCAWLLKPSGFLMLSTQNRAIYERISEVGPPSPNQIRNWVDVARLRSLAEPHFRVRELFSIDPRGHRGYLRLVNSVKLNRLLARIISSARIDTLKERLGLGSTLMLLAERKSA